MQQTTIIINVRGFKYEVLLDRLEKNSNESRLSQLRKAILTRNLNEISKLCERFNNDLNEFYFNRDPFILNQILNYYETDTLHLNHSECAKFICDELRYWRLNEEVLDDCCKSTFNENIEAIEQKYEIERRIKKKLDFKENFGTGYLAEKRENIWNLFDNPHSSLWAKVGMFI
jgi:hypothetical protein